MVDVSVSINIDFELRISNHGVKTEHEVISNSKENKRILWGWKTLRKKETGSKLDFSKSKEDEYKK